MKAAVIYKAGGPDVFQIEEREIPQVRPGWSLVQVFGCGVNHSEIFTRQGLSSSVVFPRVPGIECVFPARLSHEAFPQGCSTCTRGGSRSSA